MELFAKTVKTGLVIPTARGNMTPQSLWQLPLTGNNGFNLDQISRELLKTIRSQEQESLVGENKIDPADELRLEILKYIIDDKKRDKALREQEASNKERRDQLTKLIAEKQQEKEAGRSLESLQAELLSLTK